nr:MAG TPA: Minor capsid protein [Caudoviricetes sp.]
MIVQVKCKSASQIIRAHGLDRNGDVQRTWTNIVNRRISRYMPYRSGALSSKLKFISGPAEITVEAPYAKYQYYGKVMIDPEINAAGFLTKDGTWRSRKGAVKVLTNRPLDYDLTKNERAGSFWDRRLMAAEKSAMLQEIREYIRRREALK